MRQLGNNLPYPSEKYQHIKVFYPYRLTQKIFNQIGGKYAKRFSAFHISKDTICQLQSNIVMAVRPSMLKDIANCGLHDGIFIYSMWQGYRDTDYQQAFERSLQRMGFEIKFLHTSGHASVVDIKRVMKNLKPKKIIPIHTMTPDAFLELSPKVQIQEDGMEFEI